MDLIFLLMLGIFIGFCVAKLGHTPDSICDLAGHNFGDYIIHPHTRCHSCGRRADDVDRM